MRFTEFEEIRMIFIFGGTTEGREIVEYFEEIRMPAKYFVATEYGEEVLGSTKFVKVECGRKEKEELLCMLERERVRMVVDATHPFATQVSGLLQECCDLQKIEYLRIIRSMRAKDGHTLENAKAWRPVEDRAFGVFQSKDIHYFQSIDRIVEYLQSTTGNILLTTGSRQIQDFSRIGADRLYARVLPDEASIKACVNAGIPRSRILAMQGPFDAGLNAMLLENYGCRYLVTKESGSAGGFWEKLAGARQAKAEVLVLGRPSAEAGMSVEEFRSVFAKHAPLIETKTEISIIGVGAGSRDYLTQNALEKIMRADAICGAKRMVELAKELNRDFVENIEYLPEKITQWILDVLQAGCLNIVVLMSGDSGFYSGTKRLFSQLEKAGIRAEIDPGISCVSLMASVLGIPWDSYHILSLHGRENVHREVFYYPDLIQSVMEHEYSFAITDGLEKNQGILRELVDSGLGEVTVYIGEDLGYETQKITSDLAKNLIGHPFSKLCVLLIYNSRFQAIRYEIGMDDDAFVRGRVPMTKQEIRALSLSKLKIRKEDICFDIGAGTGSVSIEMSRLARATYAIEMKQEGIELIQENASRFGISHTLMKNGLTKYRLNIIHERALCALERLPAPDCVFVGGSGGELSGILSKCFSMNQWARVVINAVSLETIAKLCELVKHYEAMGYVSEILTVNVSRVKQIGDYHLMNAQNPVMIVSLCRREITDRE